MNAVAILKAGMVTPVGRNAAASCAAMRTATDASEETKFMFDGEWLIGAQGPFATGWSGRERLLQMVLPAIQECLEGLPPEAPATIPLLLCLAEQHRPGRITGLDHSMLQEIEQRLKVRFSPESAVFCEGRVAGVRAIERASQLVAGGAAQAIVAGVDSFFVGLTLNTYYAIGRLKTEANSNGFIPGEAAAAVLVGASVSDSKLICKGVGYGTERATIMSEEPLRSDGLRAAITNALADGAMTWEQLVFRITGANGEQYFFKEASLALLRTINIRKKEFHMWHPADSVGEIGAATVPCVLGIALYAVHKRYAPGRGILCHFSGDGEERAALVLDSLQPNVRA